MDFYEVLDQVIDLLRSRGRVTYRALKLQFKLDDESLETLKDELLYAQQVAVDEDDRVLVWIGPNETIPVSTSQPAQIPKQPSAQQDQPTQAEPSPLESHTPDAERRQLTVMFSDLVDSTKLSGQLDPEDYREVLRAYQSTCSEVIQRFGGYIAQHLGDALLVYFGYPQAHEDDAQRAVYTGLGMLNAMKTLNTRLEQDKGIRLAIRVGMHTGLTVISDVGSGQKHEMLALGEAPNIASRIQGLAEPDTIAISDATDRLVEGYFICQDLGEHSLKGVADPVHLYRVMGESGAQSRLDIAATRGLTPLVGRESEVTFLLDRWSQVKDGQGQVVLLSGEGGIGKSRLVQVLKDHVAKEAHTRWECRSSPYYQNTALYPVTDLFQRALQWQQDDTPDEKRNKLERQLNQYRLPLEASMQLLAPLLSLSIPEERYPPLHLSPQRQRQKTLEALVAMLLEQAERAPVLFILEDLHWTDPTTLALLDLLIDQTPTAAIYTLLTCRPTLQPRWSSRSYLTQVTLSHLSRPPIEQMAIQVAGGKTLPTEVIEQLVDKTDGVPLYVEEMTKAVLESGVLKEVNEHYELTGPVSSLTIPATLQDSLMARLDRLVTAKGVAQYASVIGRQFSYELLQAVSQLDEPTLQRELGRLVEAELVYQRGLPPHATYLFKHALVVDTAYESLLRSTRQGYHRRIAEVLAERFPEVAEGQPELLARHYTEADLTKEAVDYWQKAGEQVFHHSAYVEAMSHFNTGLGLLATLPPVPEHLQMELSFQIRLGQMWMVLKGYGAPEAQQAYTRAYELSSHIGENQQRQQVLAGLWQFYLVRGELSQAYELAEQRLALAQQMHEPAPGGHLQLGITTFYLGQLEKARTHLEHCLADYAALPEGLVVRLYAHDTSALCLSYMAHTLWHGGYPQQALLKSQASLVPSQQLMHPFSQAFALYFVTWLHQLRGDVSATNEHAEALMVLAREQGFAMRLAQGRILHGWSLVQRGQFEEGRAQIEAGLTAYQETGGELNRVQYLAFIADAYKQSGRIQEGLQVLEDAQRVLRDTSQYIAEAELCRLKGELLLQQSSDNATEAETSFHKALDVARSQQSKSWELRAATSLATLWQHQGKRQDAYDLLSPVYGWFTEGFDTADLKDAKALLDELR